MIALVRDAHSTTIHDNFTESAKKEFERELMVNQRKILRGELDKFSFKSDRWKKAKTQLKIETNGKCAYCEAPFHLVAYGDVEHFRPKSVYWWLAYSYENYLISCQLCNQKFKKAKFPIKNSKMRGPLIRRNTRDEYIESLVGTLAPDPLDANQVANFKELHKNERPYLLNPYFDMPQDYYAWRYDDTLREVELIPNPDNPESNSYVKAAIKYYGLNRLELRQYRYIHFQIFRTFKKVINESNITPTTRNEVQQVVQEMKAAAYPFAGMINYFDTIL